MVTTRLRVLFLSTLICCLAGDLRAAEVFPPDIKRIKDRGALIVAQYAGEEQGFFEFAKRSGRKNDAGVSYKGRRLVGFDIDLARDIARKLGVALELNRSAKTFDSVCGLVAAGKADIGISALSITLDRAQYVNFTRPYAKLDLGVLVDRLFEVKAEPWSSVRDLCNRSTVRIGVWDQTSYVTYAKKLFPKARLVFFPGLTEMRTALRNGSVKAIIADEYELVRMLKLHPSDSLKVRLHRIADMTDEFGIAVRPDSPNLLTFLNLFLRRNNTTFDIKRLLQRIDENQ